MFLINKNSAIVASLVLGAVVGLNGSVMAEETPAAAGVTATTVDEAAPSLTDRFAVRFESIYDGAEIHRILKSERLDGKAQNLRNMAYAGYKLDDTKQIGAAYQFETSPVRGGKYVSKDPNVRISNAKMISAGNFNLFSDLRLYVPGVSQNARDHQMYTAVRTTQAASYAIPSTRWTLATTGIAKTSFYGLDNGGTDMEFYVGPSASYQIAPTLSVGVLYEFIAEHKMHDSMKAFGLAHNLEPNLSWDVTPAVNLNPWVDLNPANLSLSDIKVGGQISVSVL